MLESGLSDLSHDWTGVAPFAREIFFDQAQEALQQSQYRVVFPVLWAEVEARKKGSRAKRTDLGSCILGEYSDKENWRRRRGIKGTIGNT